MAKKKSRIKSPHPGSPPPRGKEFYFQLNRLTLPLAGRGWGGGKIPDISKAKCRRWIYTAIGFSCFTRQGAEKNG